MNYCIVDNTIVTNIIVSTPAFAQKIGALPSYEGAVVGQPYDPPPTPVVEPEPTTEDDLMAMSIDHELRLSLLEMGVM